MFVRIQSRTKALFLSYGKDWGLVIVVLAAFTYIDSLEPFHRQFSVKDTTIQHPFAKKETVPIWLALVLAFILPGIIVACISILHRRSYTDLHNGLLGLFLAQALVLIVTDSVKIAVGRPRPDFLDRCLSLYDNDYSGHEVSLLSDPINMLSNSTICTRTSLLKDGFKSFPSGHSSFSFGGLGYLSMYLAGKLHLFDERGHIYKSVVVLAPLILAALIAASRVADYRHHWQDVSVGSIIGMIFAVFAYRQYYPSLAASNSDCPFAPRVMEKLLPTSLLPHHHHHHQPIPGEEDTVHPDDEVHRESFMSNHHDTNGNINNTSSTNVGSALGGARPFLRTGTSDSDHLPATSLVDMNGGSAKYNSNNSSNNHVYDQGRRG